MADNSPRIMTKQQVRQQFNTTGYLLVLYILLLMIIRVGGAILIRKFPDLFPSTDVSAFSMILLIIVYSIMGFLVFPSCGKKMGMNLRDYRRIPRLSFGKWIAMLALGTSIALLAATVSSLFESIFETGLTDTAYLGSFNSVVNILDNILFFLLYVIIKPISDEYIFRGIIERQYGHFGRSFGILASSMVFALCQPHVANAVLALIMGWYVSIMTVRYHSIEPGIRIAIAANFIMWLLQVLPGSFVWFSTLLVILIYVITIIGIVRKGVTIKMPAFTSSGATPWKILMTSPSTIFLILLFVLNIIFTILANLAL